MAKIHINNPKQVINGGAKKYYFKVKGLGGPKGDKGDKGDTGATGPEGPQGNAATVSIGSTTTLPVGNDATVTNSGSIYNAVLNFGIPQGPRGPQGATGAKGDKGDKGDQGNPGPQGEKGTNATVTVGTTTTTGPGTQAYAWNSSSNPNNAVINFNIPRGATGATGATGPQGPTGPAGAAGADGQDGQNFTPTIVETLPTTGDQSKLYLTPKAHTTSTATGNPITATVAEEAGKIESFQLDGDTFQQSYTGKNLFNDKATPEYDTLGSAGITYQIAEDGTITTAGISTSAYKNIRILLTLPAGSYKFSGCPSGGSQNGYSFCVEAGSQFVQYFDYGEGGSFTLTEESQIRAYPVRLGGGTGINMNGKVFRPMITVSTAEQTYEPYVGGVPSPNPSYPQPIQTVTGLQTITINGTDYPLDLGSIELCKLGTYQDYIYKDGDDWKVHKAVNKVVRTGGADEGWSVESNTSYTRFKLGLPYATHSASRGILASDHFRYMASGNEAGGAFVYLEQSYLYYGNQDTTVEAFKTWLSTHNTSIYYQLATATDTTITDQTLIAQLEAIRTASLENGTNTITNTATGTNLAGDMEIGYYGFNPTNRYDKFIWLDINNNYEQIGGE